MKSTDTKNSNVSCAFLFLLLWLSHSFKLSSLVLSLCDLISVQSSSSLKTFFLGYLFIFLHDRWVPTSSSFPASSSRAFLSDKPNKIPQLKSRCHQNILFWLWAELEDQLKNSKGLLSYLVSRPCRKSSQTDLLPVFPKLMKSYKGLIKWNGRLWFFSEYAYR